MSWVAYIWKFRIKSPIHIGYRKTEHFSSTRYYVYSKLLWAAITARLTRLLGIYEYDKVGEFIQETMVFSYLYLSTQEENELYLPKYTPGGLMYSDLSISDFEKQFISSKASIAIDQFSNTTEEEMLYHTEYITPYNIKTGEPNYFCGIVWLREHEINNLSIHIEDKTIFVKYNPNNEGVKKIPFREIVNNIQIGGERSSGFGLIGFIEENMIKLDENELTLFPGRWNVNEIDEVIISLEKNQFIWSHLVYSENHMIKGDIEPLKGLKWNEKGAGRSLEGSNSVYWKPGSVNIDSDVKYTISTYGRWI